MSKHRDEEPICPECAAGKHSNCSGDAWDPVCDVLTECMCEGRDGRGCR